MSLKARGKKKKVPFPDSVGRTLVESGLRLPGNPSEVEMQSFPLIDYWFVLQS